MNKNNGIKMSKTKELICIIVCVVVLFLWINDTFKDNGVHYTIEYTDAYYDAGCMYIEGIFENEGKSLNCVMIDIPVYDYNGNRIGTAYTSLSGIRHGEKWNFRAIEIGSGPFKFGEAEVIAY